jgi:hypothetical protein
VQVSATSQPPGAAARHTVADDANASAGHVAEDPVQLSATSQPPGAAARHIVAAATNPSAGQAPRPLQFSATSQPPATALRHTVAADQFEHAPAPSHLPSLPHVDCAVVVHVDLPAPLTGLLPGVTGAQLPAEPARLHELQPLPQRVLQQTPSVQKPELHSVAPPQLVELGLSAQTVLFWQKPEMQSAAVVHARPTAHGLPSPSQAAPPQSRPVSLPFLNPSPQVGVAHFSVLGLQKLLAQSELILHVLVSMHLAHAAAPLKPAPPQSVSVSLPFVAESLQVGSVQTRPLQ